MLTSRHQSHPVVRGKTANSWNDANQRAVPDPFGLVR
jgi:hypothetical protein